MKDTNKNVINPPGVESYYREWGFSPAVESNGLVFVSGCTGAVNGEVPEGIGTQTRQAFMKIKKSLNAAGLTFADVIEMTTYHVGIDGHLDEFRSVKDEFITEPFPAWTAIGVCELAAEGALIEIRVTASRRPALNIKNINSDNSPTASGGYSQAVQVQNHNRTVYISGQIPQTMEGDVPESFEEQARLAWSNVINQLKAANMTLDHLVKHTTYLSDRKYKELNSSIRQDVLQDRKPALTVIIADIYDESWLLEIEAIAVD